MHTWVLIHYKIPTEPTSRRVYIWRKLKRLGAILCFDAVWVLPATPRTQEQFQWLAAEVAEMSGDVMLWQAQLASRAQEESLVKQFMAQVDGEYAELLGALAETDADLAAISRLYQQIKLNDFFHSD
jgi:hypothetical protein